MVAHLREFEIVTKFMQNAAAKYDMQNTTEFIAN